MTTTSVFDDRELLVAAQSGDRDAAGALLERHRGVIASVARNLLHDDDLVDDIVGLVFVRALASLPQATSANPRGWLATIAANAARDALRRQRVRRTEPWHGPSHDHLLTSGPTDDPERAAIAAEAAAAVRLALTALAPRHRAILLWRERDGLSSVEIGLRLGISRSGAKVALHRARAELRAGLLRLGYPDWPRTLLEDGPDPRRVGPAAATERRPA